MAEARTSGRDYLPPVSLPPYALPTHAFRFPALAALAGRAQLGGEREVALACLMAARLAAGALPDAALGHAGRAARAAGARAWFAAMTLPAAVRVPCARLVDASAGEDRGALARALDGVTAVTAPHLDPGALSELTELAAALASAAA